MKKETTQKSKLWIWIAIAAVALLAAVGVVLALVLGGGNEPPAVEGPQGGRAELYFNIDRDEFTADSTTGLSTREPNADGKFVIRFAHDGELLELTVVDKKLVNRIDTQDVMGLVFDENGVVIDQINVRDLATEFGRRVFVRTVKDGVIIANSSLAMNGMELNISLSDITEAYDVRVNSENLGKKIDASEIETMDCISVYANDLGENTHIYLMARQPRSKVYWNATQMYNSSAAKTTRVPDENGVYTIDMYCDGELLTLKCKDADVLTSIDRRGNHNAYVCLRFDEEGYITGVIETPQGLPGMLPAYSMDVETVENGRTITVKNRWNSLYNTKSAESWSGTLPEDCPIYDVSSAALSEGRRGQLVDEVKVGDRITVWTDMEGTPILAYISQRMVEGLKPVMLMSRSYNSTTRQTTRTPDAEGYYNLEFIISGGGTKVYKTKDKDVASFIDSYAERCFGLVTRGDVIVRAYDYECIFGFTRFCTALYVDSVTGSILSASDGPQTTTYNIVLAEDYEVYDISGYGEYGARTTLKEGDVMIAFRNRFNEVCTVYVIRRYIPSGDIYFNVTKMYNATTKETTRVPDAEGWYVFDMTKDGKQTTVKTKDKALASKMENMSNDVMGLLVKGDVVQAAFPAEFVIGGYRLTAGGVVNKFLDNSTIEYHIYGNTKSVSKATLLSGYKGYNISLAFEQFKGEKTTIKAGDTTLLIADRTGKVAVAFARMRKVQTGIYWNVNSMYDSAETTYARQPDEEGWYKLQVIRNGKIETVKTKDRTMARRIDSYVNGGFTLMLKGDEVVNVASYDYATDAHSTKFGRYDVESINGKDVTVKFNRPSAAYFGTTGKFNLGNAKVFNVSPNAGEAFGQETTLQVGDRVVVYANEDGQVTNIFVTFRNGVKTAYCSHCDKEVVWNPWAGGAFEGETGHHYVYDNFTLYSQAYISGTSSNYEVVLDLNGKTITRETTGRVFVVDSGETMTILDSVGGGVVQAVGNTGNYTSVALVTGKGTMNLLSGTFKMLESADKAPSRGGVVYVYGADATFNMKGGEIIGGKLVPSEKLNPSYAGAVYLLEKATFNMSDGKITGGTAQYGGAVAAFNSSNFTMTGGTITGGTGAADANFGGLGYGGNVYIREGSTFTMTGGTITGGTAERGGNVFAAPRSKFIMTGGTIEGGSAPRGGNVYIDNAEVTVTDGTITGGKATGVGGNVMLVSNGKLNLLGGSITNGVVDATGSKYASGGNIYAWGGNSEINVAGGTVSGGVVKGGSESNNGGNICLDKDSEKVPNPSILNLTKGSIEGGNAPSNGGNISVSAGTIANIMGGTVKGGTAGVYGGNIFVMGTLNVKDGEILNGRATNCGGNIYCCGGTTNVSGGKVANGGAAEDLRGGNIGIREAATLNMTGGTVENGKASKLGGNLNIEGTFNMSGGQILGGQILAANQSGGSIAIINNGVANISGGTIDAYLDADNDGKQDVNATRWGGLIFIWADPDYTTELNISGDAVLKNGKAASNGDMIFVTTSSGITKVNISGGTLTGAASSLGAGVVNITGGTIDGGISVGAAADLTIGKTAKFTATNGGLNLLSGAMMKLDALEKGAEIYVTSAALKTPISVANEKAVDYQNYFKTGSDDKAIQEFDNRLYIIDPSDPVVPSQPDDSGFDASTFMCPCGCGLLSEVKWTEGYVADLYNNGDNDGLHVRISSTTQPGGTLYVSKSAKTVVIYIDNAVLDYNKKDTRAIQIADGATLHVIGNNGTLSGNGLDDSTTYGGLFSIAANSTLGLHGDLTVKRTDGSDNVVMAGSLAYSAGELVVDGAKLYGSELAGTGSGNDGGVVFLANTGKLTMKSGTITGIDANRGGAIYSAGGTLDMTGGTVTGGTATDNGDSIYLAAGTASITGGTVDGGIYTKETATLTVGKTAVITAANGGLYIPTNALIKLDSLETGAMIYVTAETVNAPISVANEKAEEYAEFFETGSDEITIEVREDQLYVIDPNAPSQPGPDQPGNNGFDPATFICPCCGKTYDEITWTTEYSGGFGSGHYHLTGGTGTTEAAFGDPETGPKRTFVVILDNYTLSKTNAGRAISVTGGNAYFLGYNGSSITAVGNASSGGLGMINEGKLYFGGNDLTVQITNAAPTRGGLFRMYKGEIVVDGATLIAPAALNGTVNGTNYGGIINMETADCTFTMKSGTLDARNMTTKVQGGAIGALNGTINIEGGTIYGIPEATNGGAIYQAVGTLNISGGTIDGGINTADAVNVTVSKNAKVTETNGGLNVLDGALINLGSLESDAEVYVTTANINTPFTATNEMAAGYAAYIKSTGENKKVQACNDKLYVIDTTSAVTERPCPCSVHNGAVPARSEWVVGWDGISTQFSNFNNGTHWYVDSSLTPGAVFGVSGEKEVVIALAANVGWGNKNANRTLVVDQGATVHLVGDGVVTGMGVVPNTSASPKEWGVGGLIKVWRNAKLYIHDGVRIFRRTDSTNTAAAGGLIGVQAGGQVIMNGGTLTAPETSGNGGAVAVQDAYAEFDATKFIMNAGVIDAGNSTAASGGAIWNNGGEVTIQGSARIMGTTANITNGGIIGAHQDGVPAGHATVVNILGNALLTGGKATNGDGIKLFAGTLNISQNAVLKDVNGTVAIDLTAGTTTISGGTVAGGIKLASGVDFTVSGAAKITALNGGVNVLENALIKLGEMDGAEVFVTANPNTVFANANNAAALANTAIKSADAGAVVEATGDTLKIVAASAQG